MNKKYILGMCMYSSGTMHMGHARIYTICQAIKNIFTFWKGEKVIFPFGWDAFGLPAEKFAIQNNSDPNIITKENIKKNKSEMKRMCFDIDWKYEINTSEQNFYKFTQNIIQELFNNNMLYRAEKEVPFCSKCDSILSKEQSMNDLCWRCDSKVIIKNTPQWFIKITDYAQNMYDDTKYLNWPDKVKHSQLSWLGSYKNNKFNTKIHDWCVSRQRYWGTPMPLSYCKTCGWFAGDLTEYKLPSYKLKLTSLEYKKTKCKFCFGESYKSTDTIDTFVDSSWYQYRQLEPNNTEKPFNNKHIFVNYYVGGTEHSVSHLIYARFMHRFLQKINLISTEIKEPFDVFIGCGMIVNNSKFCISCNKYYNWELKDCEFNHNNTKQFIEKMSKSKFNGISPKKMIDNFGIEALKTYLLFVAPISKDICWDINSILGMHRFVKNVQNIKNLELHDNEFNFEFINEIKNKFMRNMLKKQLNFNVLIADLHIVLDSIKRNPNSLAVKYFLYLTASFIPEIAKDCWKTLFNDSLKGNLEDFIKTNNLSNENNNYNLFDILVKQRFFTKLKCLKGEDVTKKLLENYPEFKYKKIFLGKNTINII